MKETVDNTAGKLAVIIRTVEMLVLVAVGLLLTVFPGGSLHVAVMVLGIGLLCFGIFSVLRFFLAKEKRSVLALILGIIAAAFGMVVVLRPELTENFFPTVAAGLITAGGVAGIISALKERRENAGWKSTLMLSVATVLLGVVMLITKFEENTIVRMLGTILLYIGAVGTVSDGDAR